MERRDRGDRASWRRSQRRRHRPRGAAYVCNNGGFEWRQWNGLLVPSGTARDYTTGRIERVNLATGSFERVYDSVNGNRLCGPNDIVFDRQGNMWFTDLGKRFARHRDIRCDSIRSM